MKALPKQPSAASLAASVSAAAAVADDKSEEQRPPSGAAATALERQQPSLTIHAAAAPQDQQLSSSKPVAIDEIGPAETMAADPAGALSQPHSGPAPMQIDSEPTTNTQLQAESAQADLALAEGKGMVGAHEPPAAQLPPSELERCVICADATLMLDILALPCTHCATVKQAMQNICHGCSCERSCVAHCLRFAALLLVHVLTDHIFC